MPELPEVQTVARQLEGLVSGQRIVSIRIDDTRLNEPGFTPVTTTRLKGRRISSVSRVGKQVVLALNSGPGSKKPAWLVVHLRMTGRLIHVADIRSAAGLKPRALIRLDSGCIVFSDTRRFGTLRLHYDEAEFAPPGLDPLTPAFTTSVLRRMLRGSTRQIKAWLLSQDKLTGIGNIYACEALFASGIDPRRQTDSLTNPEVARLYRVIRRILNAAIRHCGTTFSDFQDTTGSTGGYQKYLKVYGRAGEPCPACGCPIERIVQHQRSTFYCPDCQS